MLLLLSARALLRAGDVLALPAFTLVVLTWALLLALVLSSWLLREALPPALHIGARLARAAWGGLTTDPLGRDLRRRAGAAARPRPGLRRLEPPGRWVWTRLRPTERGLGLTLALALVIVAPLALWQIDRQIDRPSSTVSQTDVRFVDLAAHVVVPAQRAFMAGITVVGNSETILALLVVLVGAGLWARAARASALLIAVPLLASTTTTVLKINEARARPALGQLVETSASWPSGHATGGLALALGVCLFAWRAGVHRWAVVAGAVVPLGLLIGYSRAYLTVHWLSDVVSGWLVAILAAGVVVALDITVGARLAPAHDVRQTPLRIGAALAVALAVTSGVVRHVDKFPQRPAEPVAELSRDGAFPVVARHDDPYTRTLLGEELQPVSLVLAADQPTLRAAFAAAGFTVAEPFGVSRLAEVYRSGLFEGSAPAGAITPAFFDERLQDLSLQGAAVEGATPEVRLWRLPVRLADGCGVWVATAALDEGIGWSWRNLLPAHRIDPAVDLQRDGVVDALARTGMLRRTGLRRLVPPTLGTNAAGGPFFTDGKAAVLRQTSPGSASGC